MPNSHSSLFPSPEAEVVEAAPYQVLSRIYDEVMAHVDYSRWTNYLINILQNQGLFEPGTASSPKILDTACGTGTIACNLAMLGYNVEGRDSSAEMIAVARRRVRSLRNQPRFAVKGFLELDSREEYDAALCVYDSINYLMEASTVIDFLQRAREALKPHGLFTFDICTETNSRKYFADHIQNETRPGFRFRREARFLARERIQENCFWIEFEDQPGLAHYERHRQRIYSLSEMRKMLHSAGLKVLSETEDFSANPPRKRSLRAHFVCSR